MTQSIHIHSMTGFANVAGECGSKRVNLEIRAVNHRYLDVQFRMPEELRYLEGTLREKIAASAARGKLECRIQLQDAAVGGQSLETNEELVKQLSDLNKTWRKEHGFGKLFYQFFIGFQTLPADRRVLQLNTAFQFAACG